MLSYLKLLRPSNSVSQTLNITNFIGQLMGLRGYFMLLVFLNHYYDVNNDVIAEESDFKMFNGIGSFLGIVGFFVLSAFLLTYRLLVEFEILTSYRKICLIILQYSIRRFFHVYIVFLIFWSMVKIFPGVFSTYNHQYTSFLNGILLGSTGDNHLWTMPGQIKFYFICPIISFIAWRFKHQSVMVSAMLGVLIIFIEFVNPLGRSPHEFYVVNGHILRARLTLFLFGSLFALVYYDMKKSKIVCDIFANSRVQNLMSLLLLIFICSQFKYCSLLWNPSLNWTDFGTFKCGLLSVILLFLMLFGAPNATTKFFASYFMQKCGQFSYSMYLLQFVVMQALDKFKAYIFIYLETYTEYLILNFFCLFLISMLWFYVVEYNMRKVSRVMCDWLALSSYFHENEALKKNDASTELLI